MWHCSVAAPNHQSPSDNCTSVERCCCKRLHKNRVQIQRNIISRTCKELLLKGGWKIGRSFC